MAGVIAVVVLLAVVVIGAVVVAVVDVLLVVLVGTRVETAVEVVVSGSVTVDEGAVSASLHPPTNTMATRTMGRIDMPRLHPSLSPTQSTPSRADRLMHRRSRCGQDHASIRAWLWDRLVPLLPKPRMVRCE
jgi:hypothetical protein